MCQFCSYVFPKQRLRFRGSYVVEKRYLGQSSPRSRCARCFPDSRTLFGVTQLKLLAQQLGVAKLQAENRGGTLKFGPRTVVDPLVLVSLVEDRPGSFTLDGPSKLRFRWDLERDDDRIGAAETLLVDLGATTETTVAA